jgi:hypothetical protein
MQRNAPLVPRRPVGFAEMASSLPPHPSAALFLQRLEAQLLSAAIDSRRS